MALLSPVNPYQHSQSPATDKSDPTQSMRTHCCGAASDAASWYSAGRADQVDLAHLDLPRGTLARPDLRS
jgi:hypothetical protein